MLKKFAQKKLIGNIPERKKYTEKNILRHANVCQLPTTKTYLLRSYLRNTVVT